LNQPQTDLFTAKSVGQKEDPKEISADNPNKNPAFGGFFVSFFCFYLVGISGWKKAGASGK